MGYSLLTLLLLTAVGLLIRERRRSARKVNFLLDAVQSGDYAFKFREDGPSYRRIGINAALNRIAEILKQARTEAIEREKYYELIINQVDTGIIVADDRGNVYQCNREALRLLGLERLTHTKQLQRIDEGVEKAIADIRPGEKARATFLNERGNVDLSIRASQAELKGKQVRIIVVNDWGSEMDDNQMESWNKLIRVLTHEIMNTVTPITSLSEALLDKTADGEVKNGLEVIHTTSRELMGFVENYRRLTHLPTPHPEPFYVEPFLERMSRTVPAGTAISVSVSQPDLMVYADEGLIAHVVTNLLKNAVQAIGADGHIWLTARIDEQEAVMIDVSNDGPLIPADVAAHIFVPFFTTKPDGSGIGLSVSRQIMKLSGGTLTLKSDAKRHRTTFELTFL